MNIRSLLGLAPKAPRPSLDELIDLDRTDLDAGIRAYDAKGREANR